jgi:hypothetical protein
MTEAPNGFMRKFDEKGYVVLKGILDSEQDLQPILEHYGRLLEDLSRQLVDEGGLSRSYDGLPFGPRLAAVVSETGGAFFQRMEISLPQSGIDPDTPIHHPPEVFRLLRNPRLLDAVERFIGPEIYSNPVQHIRIKPPQRLLSEDVLSNSLVSRTFWHQDQGVVTPDADSTKMLTVWVPVTDATEENGCLMVAPGSHRRGLALHCVTPGKFQIPDRLIGAGPIPLPMKAGDVLFMHKLTMHSSLSNRSDDLRWSFDLRYNPVGQASGRSWFPGFVARSRSHPESELRDPEIWAESWRQARDHLAQVDNPKFQRWVEGDPRCA